MRLHRSLASTVLVCGILFFDRSYQVNIILASYLDPPPSGSGQQGMLSICNNIPPGVCCLPPDGEAEQVRFDHLGSDHIGAVWGNDFGAYLDTPDRCSGSLIESRRGPGRWIWTMPGLPSWSVFRLATGASYIALPKALPPDEKTSPWLMAEGMLALIWGGGAWFGNSNARKVCFDRRPIEHRRDVHSTQKGRMCARSPPRTVYADVVEVRGEVYKGNGTDGVIYMDSRGGKVNLTQMLGI